MLDDPALVEEYESLKNGSGFVRLPRRTLLEVAGEDRKKFLHNFCTADVNAIEDASSAEAFVLNGKGKVLGHVLIISMADRLLISGAGDQAETLVEHLDRYIIRDDVVITDKSSESASLFVCLPRKGVGSQLCDAPEEPFGQLTPDPFSPVPRVVAQAEIAGDGTLLITASVHVEELEKALTECGLKKCSLAVLEIIRIQNGTPWFGREIDDSNLPQELNRDEKAISFNKGCYLGQETVARIDALGHVNRRLARLSILTDAVPEIGSEIFAGDSVVGKLLSAARVPSTESCQAMAFLKRASSDAGRELKVAGCDAVVLD